MRRLMLRLAAGAGVTLAAVASAAPVSAAGCRLALVLALDVSSSVDAREDRLQREGLAAALLAPEVRRAFFLAPDAVALYAFEWSGRYDQTPLTAGWVMVESEDDLRAVAEAIGGSERSRDDMPTAMGYALGHAATMLSQGPDCLFRTVDVAGDGQNNEGFPPAMAYRSFPFEGVTVNGLVVSGADFEGETNLIPFFEREVIRGPGAFIEIARGYRDYERAMRRKLLRELSAMAVGGVPRAVRDGSAG